MMQNALHFLFDTPLLGACLCAPLCARLCLHYFQLESYQFAGYFKTLRRLWKKAFLPGALQTLWCALCLFLYERAMLACDSRPDLFLWLGAGMFVCQLLGALAVSHFTKQQKQKKPFVLTARVKRLYAWYALLMLAVFILEKSVIIAYVGAVLTPLLVPFWTALAALVALPAEKLVFHLYFADARRRLTADARLIRIGVTGSYGKTSVKFILAAILSQKYNVLATPASFNTPMGVTRVAREQLTPAHQVFIGEMGARHRGDIKEMCRLVQPQIGVLTSIGPQHLDTFGSVENIANTKYDLMRYVQKQGGTAIFFNDNGICKRLYDAHAGKKLLAGENGDVRAENVTVTPEGSAFDLRISGREPIACHTRLLGAHNIHNILLSCAVALTLGLSEKQMARGIAACSPVEHRLQLRKSAGGVTVIDDAFNSNPSGSRAALDVLRDFPGRRIIVTPGMVELGAREDDYNREFGAYMATCADLALLVGKKHTAPILEGLLGAGFDAQNAVRFDTLGDATRHLQSILRAGDVVLYENDLPDHYTEV